MEHDHPQAINFLRRDICNINDFFDKRGVKIFTQQQVFIFIVSLDIAKGKEREFLDDLIDEYEEGDDNKRDEVFNKIKIHQNLASIPLENASPKSSPTLMTSPVDFISGPSALSTFGNLLKENTGTLIA